jgi:hypothetical protein
VQVKQQWLEEGAAIQFQLPRNLTCAACDGGGCDKCGRSGAISLRERGEPAELLTVTLPRCDTAGTAGVVLRIPEQGGHVQDGPPLPRGMLLLSVTASDRPDAGVSRIRSTMPPPQVVGTPSERPLLPSRTRIALWVVWLLVAGLLAWIALRTWLRM